MSDLDAQLLRAAETGDLAGVQAALAAGADVHAYDDRPLQWAAKHGHLAVVQCLLASGADVHANRDIALRAAVRHGHTEVVQLLLDAGADVHVDEDAFDVYTSDTDFIPLCQAVEHGHLGIVRCMLAAGANPNVFFGAAMSIAVFYKRPEILTELLQAGGSLDWLGDAMQIQAVSGCEADKISVALLAGQGGCTDAILVLLERQGQTGLVAMLKATQMLETMDPTERAELLGEILAAKPPEHMQASPL